MNQRDLFVPTHPLYPPHHKIGSVGDRNPLGCTAETPHFAADTWPMETETCAHPLAIAFHCQFIANGYPLVN